MSRVFNQFIREVIDEISEELLNLLLDRCIPGKYLDAKNFTQKTSNQKRTFVKEYWKFRKYDARIINFFSDPQCEIFSIVNREERSKVRENIKTYSAQYGVNNIVMALITHPVVYTQEIGIELYRSDPETFWNSLNLHISKLIKDVIPEELCDALLDDSEVSVDSVSVDPMNHFISALNEAISLLNENWTVSDIAQIDEKLALLQNKWHEFKTNKLERTRMETKLDRIIEVQMNEPFVVETCAYLELDLNRICQMDTASYEMEKLQSLISNLQSFYTLCRDLNQVQTTLPQNRNEEEKRIVSLQGLSKKAETIYQTVLGIQESHENIKEERLSVPTLNIESDDLSEHRQITSEASQGNQDQYDKVEEHYSADLTQQFEDENHEEAVILEDIPKRENETPMEDADESEQRPVISPAQDTESAYETGIYPGNMECSPSTLTNSMDEYQKDLIVAINRNDLASAYWISREIKNQGHSVVIPDWYILANLISQHAQWVQEDIELYQYILSENEQPIDTLSVHLDCQKEQAALLIAAASLRPALIAPESTALNWLKEAAAHLYNPDDASNKLIRLTVEFLNTGIYCNIDTFHQIQLNRSWEETAIKTAHGISEWYDDIKLRRINFAPANEVQRILLDKKGPIGEIITLICRNDFKQYKYIEEKANQYLADRRTIHQFIVTTTKNIKHSGPKIPVISGNPLEVLIRRMLELRDFIHKWVGSVTAGLSQMDSELQDWSKTSINSFVRAFLAESEQLRSDSFKSGESLNYDLNLECLIRRLFCCAINRIVSELFLAETVNSHHIIQTQTMDESNMQPWMRMLRDRLLLLNKPPIGEDGYISAKILHESIAHCYDIVFAHKSIDELFSHHLSQDDYLSARLLLDAYTNDFSDLNYANMIYAEKEAEANKRLQLKIQALSQRLVQCTIDHILSEDELSNFEGSLLSIEEGQSQRLYQYFEQLDAINNNIERITQARKISLRQNIEDTLRSLQSEFKGMDKVLYEKAKSYIQKAGEQLELNEIALADEYLHYAERIVMEGEQSEIEPVESYPSVNYVKEFATAMDSLDKMLEMELNNANYRIVLSRMLNNKIPINGYRMDRVKSPRRHQEVVNGIAAWLELKRSNNPGKNLNKNIENLYIILSYMGYIVENTNAIRMLQHDDTSAHFEVRMSDGNISPLSAFGSDRDQRYDVILIYGRPNVHSIYQILSFYKVLNRCPIVFFMGRMRHKQRTEWSELLKSNGLTAMCIDEILIYYLASQPDSRLPAAISCGSAWSDIMPYRSFGIIPRELFKGRRNELKELSKPEGSCIVYGGRQFGKSVLLRMVEKENHRPEIGNYALYEDIKSLGDPQAYRSIGEIWVLLRERLISVGFLTNDECKKIDNLDDVIIDKIKRTPTMRLLVLLDETDMFLVEDAKNNFKEVTKFRRIMDETERRFKVVFCGLHSVQRYTAMQNHPFAQMMVDSLVVGPLEPAAARALITEPMTAIGFDMSHPDTEKAILKILCYTNYNPALIQHFCAELIRAVRKKKPAPPYIFSLSDVENVYMREGTRNFMRDRFIWTLDLDQHYMVIVFCMVLEQIQDRDGYRKEFSVREINTLVNDYWPEGFQNVPVENMRSYLHELCGLGVLIRNTVSGSFRLRNANVVRALGSEQEIWERLDKIVMGPPPTKDKDVENFRIIIDGKKRSPLTVKQMGDLVKPFSGIGLVFGSEALFINEVIGTLRHVYRDKEGGYIRALPSNCNTKEKILQHVQRLQRNRNYNRILIYAKARDISLTGFQLIDTLQELITQLAIYKKRNVSLRMILIVDGPSLGKFYKQSPDILERLESIADSAITLQKWDALTIQRYLSDMEFPATKDVAATIANKTGGWPFLLFRLWPLLRRLQQNPRDILEDLIKSLKANKGNMRDSFFNALGIESIPHAVDLLTIVKECGTVERKDIEIALEIMNQDALQALGKKKIQGLIEVLLHLGLLEENNGVLSIDDIAGEVVLTR